MIKKMKTKNLNKIIAAAILALSTLSLSSCLKDSSFIDLSTTPNVVDMPMSGPAFFGNDAIVAAGIDTLKFAVELSSPNTLSSPLSVTVGVDNTIVTSYDAANPSINYLPFPSNSYTFPDVTITIPAGQRVVYLNCVINRNMLSPSSSYMLPMSIKSAPGATISGNFGVHYYHVIGNDFAGSYTWDYRRWQNGTGPGANNIPPDITGLGQSGTIYPISPTEIQMLTGYNGTGVNYDITFKRSVSGSTVTYSNWSVQFLPGDLAKWTAAGISNMVPPKFTVPPPATNASPKVFEMNYVSGGASGRYIDDTYH